VEGRRQEGWFAGPACMASLGSPPGRQEGRSLAPLAPAAPSSSPIELLQGGMTAAHLAALNGSRMETGCAGHVITVSVLPPAQPGAPEVNRWVCLLCAAWCAGMHGAYVRFSAGWESLAGKAGPV